MTTKGMTIFAMTARFDELKRFYEAGLAIEGNQQGSHWVSFAMGDSEFALHAGHESNTALGLELTFIVDDLDVAVGRFRVAGGRVNEEPHDEDFGRAAVLEDPEGRPFTLVER